MFSKRKKKNDKVLNEERRIITENMNKGKTNLMGDLAKAKTPGDERVDALKMELDADERNRITVKMSEPEITKRGRPAKKKKVKDEYKSKKNEKALKEEYEKDYVWVRRELEGYAPLRSLDIWNKIRTSIKYMDEKKGKTARKNAEAERLQNMRRIKIESEMKKKITEYTEDIIEHRTLSQELEITLRPEHIDVLKSVIQQEYFTMFDISVIETNPNLKRYGINPPILINISKKGVVN